MNFVSDINTPIGNSAIDFYGQVYDAYGSRPRKVKDDFTLEMANSAKRKLNLIQSSITAEIRLFRQDLEKCSNLLSSLSIVDEKISSTSTKVLSSQQNIKTNFHLGDGASPGISHSEEAAKQLSEAINIKSNLRNEIEKIKTQIENAIKDLNNIYNTAQNYINEISGMIRNYHPK